MKPKRDRTADERRISARNAGAKQVVSNLWNNKRLLDLWKVDNILELWNDEEIMQEWKEEDLIKDWL